MLHVAFVLCLGFFDHEACGILASLLGMEPIPSALEGKVFTTGPPGKSQGSCFLSLGGMRKTRSGRSHRDPGPLALSTSPFVSLSVRRRYISFEAFQK